MTSVRRSTGRIRDGAEARCHNPADLTHGFAMLSPSNTSEGLTLDDALYATGTRNYFRITAPDFNEAAAHIELVIEQAHPTRGRRPSRTPDQPAIAFDRNAQQVADELGERWSASLGSLNALLRAEASGLLRDLPANVRGQLGADADECDSLLGEAELDVLAWGKSPLQVPAHAQLDEAVGALDRRREDMRSQVRAIFACRNTPDSADSGSRQCAEATVARPGEDDPRTSAVNRRKDGGPLAESIR